MRKHSYIFAALALGTVLSLSGCKSREKIDLTGIHSTEAETMAPASESKEAEEPAETMKETENAPTETDGSSAGASGSAQSLSVRSKIATEKTGKVSIEYPILSNLPAGSPQEAVNALIKEKATQILKDYELNPEEDTVSIQCSILSLDRSKAVLAYTGSIMRKDAAYAADVFYTTTVDLVKGVLVGLSDYADAYTMAGYILSDDCILSKPAGSKEVLEYLQSLDINELWAILRQCDFTADKLEGFPQSFSYENQGSVYMALPVPHVLGDYAVVRFNPDTK